MRTFKKSYHWALISIFVLLLLAGCDNDTPVVDASVYTPGCEVQELIQAINDANADGVPSEIELPPDCVYNLTHVDNSFPWNNMIINNGLPAIISEITIWGNNSKIKINPAEGEDPFGHFYLDVESKLYLYDLTLKKGTRNAGGAVLINHGDFLAYNVKFVRNRAIQPTTDTVANGGAIYNYFGKVRILANSRFRWNMAGIPVPAGDNLGGAIYSINGSLMINDSAFLENYVAGHGGAVHSEKTATHTGGGIITVQNGYFLNNEAVLDGGALSLVNETDGVFIVTSQFEENLSGRLGGAIFSQDSDLTTDFVQFHYNEAENGGAVYTRRTAEGEMSIFIADSSVYSYNTAEDSAGAVFSENADFEAENSIFVHNEADSCGGLQLGGYPGLDVAAGELETAPKISSHSEMSGGSIYYNRAFYGFGGGACHLMGELILDDVGVSGNQTPSYGGGLLSMDQLDATNAVFSNNQAYRGGGLAVGFPQNEYNPQSPAFLGFYSRLTEAWVRDNEATDQGGGIWVHNGGSLQIVKSVIGRNTADQEGGGVYLDEGNLYLDNSTLASNQAFRGGGLYNVGGNSSLRLMHTTVAYNIATDGGHELRSGGGGVNINGTVYINEALVVLNTNKDCDLNQGLGGDYDWNDCGDPYCINTLLGIDSDETCGLGTETSPQVGSFNGKYVPILSGSPIIDRSSCMLQDDQIGTGRPQGSHCEPGSIEYQDTAPPPPPPPSAPEPEEEESDCDPFAGMEPSLRMLNINPDTLVLPVYLRFTEAVPDLPEDGTIPFWASLGGKVSYLTNQQGFDNRIYFMVELGPEDPGTLQLFEVFKEGCDYPVFTELRLTIPEIGLTIPEIPAEDEEPSCRKDLGAEECKKVGGTWYTEVPEPYCKCP